MFSIKNLIQLSILLLAVPLLPEFGNTANAQPVQRIGVFDSRVIAIAYYNSRFSNTGEIFQSLHQQLEEAKSKDDKEKISSLEREADLRQAIMHEQGFGQGSVASITGTIKDNLAKLAGEENLSAIISKWEAAFISKDTELIDVTEKVADFFEPSDKIRAMINEIMNSEPIKDAYLIRD